MKDGGTYVVEDLHTSYAKMYGGRLSAARHVHRVRQTSDGQLNAWHAPKADRRRFKMDTYTRTITGMHVYSSVIVFDKGTVVRPHDEQHGRESGIKFRYLGMEPDEE